MVRCNLDYGHRSICDAVMDYYVGMNGVNNW